MDNNQNWVSVAETSSPSEENSTTLTLSVRDTREISYGFFPEKNLCGTQSQSILTNFSSRKNITYKKKVVVQEVHYSTYYVLVTYE